MKTPRFEIFEGKNNEFFFRLKAKNGRIILSSEGYTKKHNAEKGITAVITSSHFEERFNWKADWTGAEFSPLPNYFYFVLEAQNGETIAVSETYTKLRGCIKGIASVRRCAPIAEIVDLSC